MLTKRIAENEYEVQVYDWNDLHDDYVCGHAKRQPNADEDSDLRYWMFYPIGGIKPLSVGDLRRISEFMAQMNTNI